MTGPTDRAADQRYQREQAAHAAARARKTARQAHRAGAHARTRAHNSRLRTRTLDHLLAREHRDLAVEVERRRAELDRLARLMAAPPRPR